MSAAAAQFETLLYGVADAVATITLNRPDSLNTIVPPMPEEVEAAVELAVRDEAVKVIVLRGAGRSFCAGYDFGGSRPRLAAADAARGGVLGQPNSAAIRPPCVLAPLGPALASRGRACLSL